MEDFQFYTPVKVYFGQDSHEKLASICKNKKVMLVYGQKAIKENGVYEEITRILNENDISYTDFRGNKLPLYKKILEAVEICKKEKINCIIGIGGCTCMDMAKIISFVCMNEDHEDYIFAKKDPVGKKHLETILIPTYASGGSEIDAVSEVDDLEKHRHGSLYGIYADYAILNPEFTYSVSKKLTVNGALVSFIQMAISYIKNENPVGKVIGRALMKMLLQDIDNIANRLTNYELRAEFMWLSSMSTVGFLSAGMGGSYAWSIYSFETIAEALYGIDYRTSMVIFFPAWLKVAVKKFPEEIKAFVVEIFDIDGRFLPEKAVEKACKKWYKLLDEAQLPTSYDQIGKRPEEKDLKFEIKRYLEKPFTEEEVYEMMKLSFKGN